MNLNPIHIPIKEDMKVVGVSNILKIRLNVGG